MEANTDILIVGAGPTGLLLACVLHQHGIAFRIIEKKSQPTQTSNALGLHARTLELLDDLNIVDPFLKAGKKVTGAALLTPIDLTTIPGPYPFILILPQSETENILTQFLKKNNVTIEQNTELTQFKNKSGYCISTIKQQENETDIQSRYLIACDGAHSKVRELCDIKFTGKSIPEHFALADASVTSTLAQDKLHVFFSPDGLLATFPLPNGDLRIIFDLPSTQKYTLDNIDFPTQVAKRSNQLIQWKDCKWRSTFAIRSRVINDLRHGQVFFAGDSAHTHSPAGGQGMNTGMQDAYNLGWKLAYALQKKSPESILNSYQQERHPVAEALVKETDKLTRFMLSKNPLKRAIRNYFIKPILHSPSVNKKIALKISMLAINYPHSPIINYKSVISNHAPKPGYLAPNPLLLQPYYLHHYLRGNSHWLLIFTGKQLQAQQLDTIKSIIESLSNISINYFIITPTPLDDKLKQLNDTDQTIHREFCVNQPGLCLIRPDKYIAFESHRLDKESLHTWIKNHL